MGRGAAFDGPFIKIHPTMLFDRQYMRVFMGLTVSRKICPFYQPSWSSRMSPQAGYRTKITSVCVKCNWITIYLSQSLGNIDAKQADLASIHFPSWIIDDFIISVYNSHQVHCLWKTFGKKLWHVDKHSLWRIEKLSISNC